jgi:DNA-binding transcriptional LysR family regulator
MVLAAYPPPPLPVSVLYPQNRQLSSRVRVFAEWLKEVFASAGASSDLHTAHGKMTVRGKTA